MSEEYDHPSASESGPPELPPGPPPVPPAPPVPPRFRGSTVSVSGKAVAALLLGAMGTVFWIFTGIPAIVLALLARSDIRNNPETLRGRGLANAALVLGLASFVMPAVIFSMLIGMLAPDVSAPAFDASHRIPHFHLSGSLFEEPQQSSFTVQGVEAGSLKHLLQTIARAQDDDSVHAIVFTFDQSAMGLAQTEELWQAIQSFKASGKKVYAHAEDVSTSDMFLLSAASHLNVVPTSGVFLTGLYTESVYLKDAMEKIGLKADVVHIGDYKSAGEMFTNSSPSEPARMNMNELMDGLYEGGIDMIAEARGMSVEHVRELIDGGPYTLEQAMAAGLVDSAMHLDDYLDMIREEYGDDTEIDNYYDADDTADIDVNGPLGVFTVLARLAEQRQPSYNDAIGVVYVEGAISTGHETASLFGDSSGAYSGDIRKILEWAGEDETIRAVVLRVDSPGGSATASEVILHAAEKLKAKKPLIVSMGNTAASGGYYVSCGADAIFANATTVTGSIGVVGGKAVTTDMWGELGINWYAYQRGANADLFSSAAPFSDAQRERIVETMEDVYATFKDRVETGRGDKLVGPLESLAGGRVYTGKQALDVGLVDHIGGLQDAISFAAEQAGIEDYDVRVLPEPMDVFQQWMLSMSGGGERTSDLRIQSGHGNGPLVPTDSAVRKPTTVPPLAGWLDALEPERARAMMRALRASELLRREGVVAIMPELLVIR